MNTDLMFSSIEESWETPQEFFDALNAEFHFTVDVCADQSNHKCVSFYTEKDDGLAQSWEDETVWCNPPYGRKLSLWVEKAFKEVYDNGCKTVVMLIPARTDTKWFHDYILHRSEIRFVRGRLKFGGSKNNAPFPSMVVVFRGKCERKKELE